jgi:hypothetical protein
MIILRPVVALRSWPAELPASAPMLTTGLAGPRIVPIAACELQKPAISSMSNLMLRRPLEALAAPSAFNQRLADPTVISLGRGLLSVNNCRR